MKNRQDALEIDTIAEMLLESPHAVVNSIAAQALARLPGKCYNRYHGLLHCAVLRGVEHFFDDCFRWISTPEGLTPSVITASETTTERLARACLNLYLGNPLRLRAPHDALRVYFDREINDLRAAAIHAALLSEDTDRAKEDDGELVRQILARPSEVGHEVHPWIKDRLLDAAIMSARQEAHSREDWNVWLDRFLRDLSGSLGQEPSFAQPETLQGEMLTSMIGSRPTTEEQQGNLVKEGYINPLSVCLARGS